MKKYKLYAIDLSNNFKSFDCLVCATTKNEALEVAQSDMPTTRIKISNVKEILMEQTKILFN